MRIKNIPYFVVFFSLFGLYPAGSAQVLTVNYPPDKTVMEFDLLSISMNIPQGSADLIEIRVNNRKTVSIAPSRPFECFSVPLELGMNKIDISAKKEDRVVDGVSFKVFRRSDLKSKYEKPPVGFKKNYFHMKDRQECAACHTLEPTEADKKFTDTETIVAEISKNEAVTPPTSTCFSCHKAMTSHPFVHGPASVWSCLSCHDSEAGLRYQVKNPDRDVCLSCHVQQKRNWNTKKYFHAPFNTGKCHICHNPHASEHPFNLVRPAWMLCLNCHTDKSSGKHIIARYVYGESHPTHGVPDPRRKGRELTCASCHEPHASDSPKFSTLNPESGFAMCKECHIDPQQPLIPVKLF